MTVLLVLIPISIFLGLCGLGAFLWSLRTDQYRDLEGDAARILFDEEDRPRADPSRKRRADSGSETEPEDRRS